MTKTIGSKMADKVLQYLTSNGKLDRDKGVEALKKLLDTKGSDSEDITKSLQVKFSVILNEEDAPEKLQGCLAGVKELSPHLSKEFCDEFVKLLPKLLDSKEPRVRQLTGEVVGAMCAHKGVGYYVQCRETILSGIRSHLERNEELAKGGAEAEKLKEKLSSGGPVQDSNLPGPSPGSSNSSGGGGGSVQIFHDTAGWRGLETYMHALQQSVEGCGVEFEPHITSTLLDLLFTALAHTNRFVRESGFKALAVVASCVPVPAPPSPPPPVVGDHWAGIARHIAQGLADNWSQVRMASSTAARAFLLNIACEERREPFLPALLPAMCLNRYYVAEGVRLYSQETWRLVMRDGGVAGVERHIPAVVGFYVRQSEADNHAVREAACMCIAELGKKVRPAVLEPHVGSLLPALLGCFRDDSWPVRDAACLACGNFIGCFPAQCQPFREELLGLFLANLEDSIASVRQGAAAALAAVVGAYAGDSPLLVDRVVGEAGERLRAVEKQPADDGGRGGSGGGGGGTGTSSKHPGIDPTPAEFGVVKAARDNDPALHTDQTMYSCGSLAPKLQRSGRGGGCMDHGFRKPSQPWERSEGCVHLVGELSRLQSTATAHHLPTLLPLVAAAASHKHYVQHVSLVESVLRQLPVVAKNMGKKQFKPHLAEFLDALFYGLASSTALLQAAAVDCVQQLSALLGRMIFRGRVELHNPAYLPLLDRTCP